MDSQILYTVTVQLSHQLPSMGVTALPEYWLDRLRHK